MPCRTDRPTAWRGRSDGPDEGHRGRGPDSRRADRAISTAGTRARRSHRPLRGVRVSQTRQDRSGTGPRRWPPRRRARSWYPLRRTSRRGDMHCPATPSAPRSRRPWRRRWCREPPPRRRERRSNRPRFWRTTRRFWGLMSWAPSHFHVDDPTVRGGPRHCQCGAIAPDHRKSRGWFRSRAARLASDVAVRL